MVKPYTKARGNKDSALQQTLSHRRNKLLRFRVNGGDGDGDFDASVAILKALNYCRALSPEQTHHRPVLQCEASEETVQVTDGLMSLLIAVQQQAHNPTLGAKMGIQ